MYLDSSTVQQNRKSYTRILLRESYRESGQVKKRTVANLSHCSPEEIEAIRFALEHKGELKEIEAAFAASNTSKYTQGASIGSTWLLFRIAKRVGIVDALGNSVQGKLALWQVIARVLGQGSRLSAVRLAENRAVCDILNLKPFHEDHLYPNLDWLSENQAKIEDRLFQKRHHQQPTLEADLFLYDVTSSYLEGVCNELAFFGYCRDKKKGKRQIVVGLLCDKEGDPVSVEVFPGNTQDMKTFSSQVKKTAERFGGESVTFVGDRGMIKNPQIEEIAGYEEKDFHYITAITRVQIETLLKEDKIQMSLFDYSLAEIEEGKIRYILRRNPVRMQEIQRTRHRKLKTLEEEIERENLYLREHPKAKIETAIKKMGKRVQKLKIGNWLELKAENEILSIVILEEKLSELEKLDGCYVLKTDLPTEKASKEIIHDRYKDLAMVEWAFRTSKTTHLEVRPIHVRLEERTKGHVFVVMLSYLIVKELRSCWKSLNKTVEEGIKELDSLCAMELSLGGNRKFHHIPKPRELSQDLLEAAEVILPNILPCKGFKVVTRKKLQKNRKI